MDEVTITAPAFTMNAAPHWVALDKGFFQEEGIKVNFVFMGLEREREFPGQVVFNAPGGSAPFTAQREGRQEINIVSTTQRPHHVLVARPEIQEVKDLKGKRIIAGKRGASYVDAVLVLKRFGLEADDVEWVASEDIPPDTERARIEALAKGEVDAVCSGPAHWMLAVKMGCRRLPSARDFISWPEGGLATSPEVIARHPDLCHRVVRAMLRGIEFARQNKEETLDIVLRHTLYIDRDTVSQCYDAIHNDWATPTDLSLYRLKMKTYCELYGLLQKDFKSYYEVSSLRRALEELKLLREWKD